MSIKTGRITMESESENQFYYEVYKQITNIYDVNPLQIVGHVKIYTDEEKQNLLTELPFSELGIYLSVSECPTSSKEDFDNFINDKVIEKVNAEEVQNKLNEVKMLTELGII